MINHIYIGGYWRAPANRKKFFDDFARDHNFDPLVPRNWYSVTSDQIKAARVRKGRGREGERARGGEGERGRRRIGVNKYSSEFKSSVEVLQRQSRESTEALVQ